MVTSDSSQQSTSEIVFFDLETTVPTRVGQKFVVLEFGAIIVCSQKLVEIEGYSTLIRPKNFSAVALTSARPDGITYEAVSNAPPFEEVADRIFSILNGRIWAGHNIQRFDCVRIKEAFAEIGRAAPVPLGIIDSLGVLTEKFGRRAGNMKLATLAAFFGLGRQKHRSLDDVRLNLEVLKRCAAVLFLEASLPSVGNGKWRNSSSIIMTRSRSNGKLLSRKESSRKSPPAMIGHQRAVPYAAPRSLGKMTKGMKNLLCKGQQAKSLNRLPKHSQSLLGRA